MLRHSPYCSGPLKPDKVLGHQESAEGVYRSRKPPIPAKPWWGMCDEPVLMRSKEPMDTYDPLKAPDPGEWLSMGEDERIALVVKHHGEAGVELPEQQIHAVVHAVVENQIALGDEVPIRTTLDRLVKEGLDRHEPVHAIGSVLAENLQDLLNDDEPTPNINERFFQELNNLKAAEWLRNFD